MKINNNNLQQMSFKCLVPGGYLKSKLGGIPFFTEIGENAAMKEFKVFHALDLNIAEISDERFPAVIIDQAFKETLSEQELLYVLHKEAGHLVLKHHLSNISMIRKLSAADVYAANMSEVPVYTIKRFLIRIYDEAIVANNGNKKLTRALQRGLKIRLQALTMYEISKNLTIKFLCFVRGIKRPDVFEA